MFRLTIQFGVLVILLLFGIILGINVAEKGIYRVAGSPDMNSKSFQIKQGDNQVEVMVLGKTYISKIPKKDMLSTNNNVSINKINFLSVLGNELGEYLQKGTRKGLELLTNLLKS
ncbi:hypothetical protein BHF71_04185 [Vulcanibacillus modesticaldus]|uniref:DUF3679 domain-containing protein n=1 Tax=Vulcanibacillus modesticaldus TaxID=337097 RepID=A0A1D2YSB2_9BACI|nr:DUF3679 domain-containing protein [Vulcanibacillus modesticaldus]OEF96934.1 hypothetical protein BHF71_04185 [Vulcanibacillus modesticaldus]